MMDTPPSCAPRLAKQPSFNDSNRNWRGVQRMPDNYAPPGQRRGGPSIVHLQIYLGRLRVSLPLHTEAVPHFFRCLPARHPAASVPLLCWGWDRWAGDGGWVGISKVVRYVPSHTQLPLVASFAVRSHRRRGWRTSGTSSGASAATWPAPTACGALAQGPGSGDLEGNERGGPEFYNLFLNLSNPSCIVC